MTPMTSIQKLSRFVALAVLVASAVPAAAQIPNASAAAFGMAGNCTAAARGYDAVAWNPANLGFSPGFSMSILSAGGTTGLDPVRLSDFGPFQGKILPSATKESWLRSIGAGTERGSLDGGLSIVAMSIENLAFQVGVTGTGQANLNQDAAEAILFGNAGRTGSAKNLSFNGSNAGGSGFATGAVSLGIPVTGDDRSGRLSIGVTGKYIRGIATAQAADNGSSIGVDNVNVQFPVVYTDSANLGNAGSGVGVDVGLAWHSAMTTVAVAAHNVVNTFAWSTAAMRSRVGGVTFNGITSTTTFDEAPYASAPAALRSMIEAQKFKPEISVGIAHQMSALTLTADASQRLGDGIEIGPKMHAGVGAEFTGIPVLSLRAGAAVVSGGYQAAGGVGLRVGPLELGAALSTRSRNSGQELGAMVSLMSIR
jgi:hypothetical protein